MMRQTKLIDVKIIEVKAIALGLAMSRAPADYLCKSCTYPSIYAVVFNAPPNLVPQTPSATSTQQSLFANRLQWMPLLAFASGFTYLKRKTEAQ